MLKRLRKTKNGTESEASDGGPKKKRRWLVWSRRGFRRQLRKAFSLERVLALVLLVGVVVLRALDPTPIKTLRVRVFDYYQQIQPRERVKDLVVVADIDEESLGEFGQWPWPRTILAELVERLMNMGALSIGFDMVFPEEDRMSPSNLAKVLQGIDGQTQVNLDNVPTNDAVFASILRQSRVVLGESAFEREVDRPQVPREAVPIARIGSEAGVSPDSYIPSFPSVVRNIPELEEAATGTANIKLVPEPDGIVRRVPLMIKVRDRLSPALSLEMLRVASGGNAYAVKASKAGVTNIVVANKFVIPTDRNGQVWVHYAPYDRNQLVSVKSILDGTLPVERVRGKFVLVGTSAVGLHDIKATSIDDALPGVLVHAQILESTLTNAHLNRPTWALGAEVILVAFVGLLMIFVVPFFGALLSLVSGALISGGLVGTSWYLFTQKSVMIDVTYTMIGGLLVYGLLVFMNYFREEARRRQVRGAFSQYLSPALVDQLASDPDRLVLGGETRKMTFLFSDVRGFTTISEKYKTDPQGLTRLMNAFLTPLTQAVLHCQGTIDKYMGDAIMAFWNAPIDDEQHSENACQAAIEMLDELAAVNKRLAEEAEAAKQPFDPLRVGIGINTGTCVVGNMGSDQRFDYTVLGDSVNLASRLEGQSKNYGVDVVLGDETAQKVNGRYALIELDLIKVKGKTEPERIFSLLGNQDFASGKEFITFRGLNEQMLKAYRAKDWETAKSCLRDMTLSDIGRRYLGLLELHMGRVQAFQEDPPGEDWDGVFVAKSK